MPVRLVCPSCSATLSVKDEFAGRAVRCPKCGGVIPATPSGASAPPPSRAVMPPIPVPEPPPAPPPAPFEGLDEPAPSRGGKIVGRPTGRPVAPVPASDERDEDEERPARRRGPGEEGRNDADRGDDDRPVRRRRPRDDEYDQPEGKKGGKGPIIIVAILCGTLLTCCGGVGYGGWWLYSKAKKAKDDIVEAVDKMNLRVNSFSYADLEVGTVTRTETDAKLGSGRVATDADLPKVFATDPQRADAWADKVRQKRAVVWQNGDDYIIAAFHPTADGNARLQAKEWRPKSGAALREGEVNDFRFMQQYPPGGGPGVSVTAAELAGAYKDNATTANEKYKNKNVLVEGKLDDLSFGFDGEVQALLEGVPPAPGKALGTLVRVVVSKSDVNKVLNVSRGQTLALKGKCSGLTGDLFVDVLNATVESTGVDPAPTVSAALLLAEYGRNNEATDEKYKDKPITITNAVVESKDGEQSVYVVGNLKKSTVRIKVTLPFDTRKQTAALKVGDRLKIKGEYSSSSDNVIYINRAWIVP
ncbi:tRNA-anti-like protein [Gemmata sp. SH-PL17]|uniref:OB-fold protein n=1 Tax=Gemmata sp. SH-PL17 TaxID=1630693 RepID=UPI00078B52D6|nr:MJ0042-type zinc finger domain-containing protein [Gemmata sp. SH-PL17]AMV29260.1 tRNA-anti-like protein [Gemmata sp. SH-PL17]